MSQGYDFGALYGMADTTGVQLLDKGTYDAVCTESEWGATKDGTKGQWTVKTKVTTGQYAGAALTGSITVNQTKNDGSPNPQGLGIMFRELAAFGIPVPPDQPFWALGWTPQQVAQAMVGKPLQIQVIQDEYDGTTRNKIRTFRAPRPGAPVQVEQQPQMAAGPGGVYGTAVPGGYQPYGQPPAQQPGGYPQQPDPYANPYTQPQPAGYGQQPAAAAPGGYGYQQPVQQQGPVAPGPWQNAQPQGAGPQQPQQQAAPGVPAWAQPPQPGQGGQGEFTAQGQSWQPGGQPQQQPTPQQPGVPQPQFQPPQQPPQGQPNGAAPAAPFNGQPQGQPNQPPQGAPELPPWAQ